MSFSKSLLAIRETFGCLTTWLEPVLYAAQVSQHSTPVRRLLDIIHDENRLYLVFEFLDLDLKRYMDTVPTTTNAGLPLEQVKVRERFVNKVSRSWR